MTTLFGKKLCESCFSENSADPCSKCGFSAAQYHPDATALPIGRKLQERYLIGGVIGKGGFGITYTGYDEMLGRRVAIKEYYPYGLALRTPGTTMVSAPDADSEDVFSKGAERFYDEAKLVAQFGDNPNIVNVYDFFYENSTVYYVMEYLQGQSMKKHIDKHGVVSEKQAVYIAKEVSNALVSAHSANVLHRDISPDNIMLCNDGKVKLIDFGAARQVLTEGSQSLSVILKQGFAPLEQYQKKGKQGPWTDIYALGATIYYIVTGDLLDDPMSRLDDDEEFSSNIHGINEELWTVIKKSTMLKINDRYKDIFEFRAELNKISLDSVPLTVRYDNSVEIMSFTAESADAEASIPVKEASPVRATMPVKESAPIGATMPVKKSAPIGATMPVKESAPIGATMPVKESAPIGETMPVKEADPIGVTKPVKEQASNEKKTDFTDKYGDEKWRLEAKRAASAAAYERRQQVIAQNKKKLLIVGVIGVIIIIFAMCIFFGTHVKVGKSWYKDKNGTVEVLLEKNISDLSALAKRKDIRSIIFGHCSFSDPSVLEDLKELENLSSLTIHTCHDFNDVSALEGLTGLTELTLDHNNISDISPLEGLTGLTTLVLSYNDISDISALEGMTKLTDLYMWGNNISDLSSLKSLTKLNTLCLTYNGKDYRLNDDEIQEFLNENVKTYNSQAEPVKPAVTEPQKPAVTEPEKPVVTEPKKPAVTEPEKPAVTEPEKPAQNDPIYYRGDLGISYDGISADVELYYNAPGCTVDGGGGKPLKIRSPSGDHWDCLSIGVCATSMETTCKITDVDPSTIKTATYGDNTFMYIEDNSAWGYQWRYMYKMEVGKYYLYIDVDTNDEDLMRTLENDILPSIHVFE